MAPFIIWCLNQAGAIDDLGAPWGTSIYVKNKKDLYADGLNDAGPSHWKPARFSVLHA